MKQKNKISDFEKIISYTLSQERSGTLSFGRKDNNIYICFKNEELQDFFREWFEILLLYNKGKVKESTYRLTVEAMTQKFNIESTEPTQPPKEEVVPNNDPTDTVLDPAQKSEEAPEATQEAEQGELMSMDDDL